MLVNGTTDSTSIGTGSLIVKGGLGIAKDLYAGADVNIVGGITAGSIVPTANNTDSLGASNNQYLNVYANNFGEYDLSSARENTRTISYGLNTVMSLSPKEYNNVNYPTRNRVGFIPEEVEEFIPEV